MKSKLLLIAMADSVHVARWLGQMKHLDLEIELVSSSPHRKIHPQIRKLILGEDGQLMSLKISKLSEKFSLALWFADRLAGDRFRGYLLTRTIRRFNPSVIHALEFQHAGYMLNRVPDDLLSDRVVAVTNYGSDIFWFSRFPNHRLKIIKLLGRADAYTAECSRDENLARRLGFAGSTTVVFPNTGGLSSDVLEASATSPLASQRTVILIKGYQNQFGRAFDALRALVILQKELKDVQVVIFSANVTTALAAIWLRVARGMNIEIHAKGKLSHDQMLDLFRRARCYIGLSRSDGISTSLLEAMAMGAFPIQSGTACASEWSQDGATAFIVTDHSPGNIASLIQKAMKSDALVDAAQLINRQTIADRYSTEVVGKSVRSFYEELFERNQA